eukprot:54250-Chlamydomonas_euryale.AAC.1
MPGEATPANAAPPLSLPGLQLARNGRGSIVSARKRGCSSALASAPGHAGLLGGQTEPHTSINP